MLLEKGADKSLKTVEGETPLDWAKEIGDTEMAAILK
jgi:ankyrin repeat protein